MMIERFVRERLLNVASGGVHIGVAPIGTVAPYLRVFLVSGTRDWTLAGPSGARSASVQVDAWASTPKHAAELIEQALDAVSVSGDDFACNGADDLGGDDDEQNTKLHRASMEFFLTR